MDTKICNQCSEDKPLMAFDGNRNTCRKCRNKKNMGSYLSKEGNKEKQREYMRKYLNKAYELPEYDLYQRCLADLRKHFGYIKRGTVNQVYTNLVKEHFESFFNEDNGFNWNNHGQVWQIDHIKSGVILARNGYKMYQINAFENIRPLSVKDNQQRYKGKI